MSKWMASDGTRTAPISSMRSMWKGTLGFGLLSIPVTVHAATGASERISFRLLHKKDMAPVKNQRVCSLDGEVLEWGDIVKGYEYAKGQFAPVEKEEIEQLREEAGQDIELLEFVDRGEIDPMSFDTPYFVRPDKGGERAYAVLHDALREMKRVGIVRWNLRGHPHLAVVHVEKEALAMTTLRPAEELRDVAELDVPTRSVKAEEVKMASTLIDEMTSKWRATEYRDEYRERLQKLVESKVPKKKLRELKEARATVAAHGATDLVEALRKSLGGAARTRSASHREASEGEGAAPHGRKRAAAKHRKNGTRRHKAA